ncbi:MAG TPA: hypothetical protein VF522_18995 [Ramlibacter sp.]|uniref:hypothetical protein n=1 Tax=Ramlibacter sp. TaxID=1917967 RepID=UPI002ED6463A
MVTTLPDSVSATEVKVLLVRCRGDWPEISYQAKVSHSWISKFVNGHITNPGYRTLLDLREFLLAREAGQQSRGPEAG